MGRGRKQGRRRYTWHERRDGDVSLLIYLGTSTPTLTSVITKFSETDKIDDTEVGSSERIVTGRFSAWNKFGVVKLNAALASAKPQLLTGVTLQ